MELTKTKKERQMERKEKGKKEATFLKHFIQTVVYRMKHGILMSIERGVM
jgi:hypothetical protein